MTTEPNNTRAVEALADAEKTYTFTIVMEQNGTNEDDAWDKLLDDIAMMPREAIDSYRSAVCYEDEEALPENKGRARRAQRMVEAYTDEEGSDAVEIILADLRHYCDANELDFSRLDRKARDIYQFELGAALKQSKPVSCPVNDPSREGGDDQSHDACDVPSENDTRSFFVTMTSDEFGAEEFERDTLEEARETVNNIKESASGDGIRRVLMITRESVINDESPFVDAIKTVIVNGKDEADKETGDDLCDLCMTSNVRADRTTYCGKTIGIDCGCNETNKAGVCDDDDCEDCAEHRPTTRYLLRVVGDIEPKLLGPYDTDDLRFEAARALKRENGDDDGLFPINIDESGKPGVWAYTNGDFEDLDDDDPSTDSGQRTAAGNR